MTFILDSEDVYVVTHIHNNKILRMEVFSDYDRGRDKSFEWKNEGIEGDISFTECTINTKIWRE